MSLYESIIGGFVVRCTHLARRFPDFDTAYYSCNMPDFHSSPWSEERKIPDDEQTSLIPEKMMHTGRTALVGTVSHDGSLPEDGFFVAIRQNHSRRYSFESLFLWR